MLWILHPPILQVIPSYPTLLKGHTHIHVGPVFISSRLPNIPAILTIQIANYPANLGLHQPKVAISGIFVRDNHLGNSGIHVVCARPHQTEVRSQIFRSHHAQQFLVFRVCRKTSLYVAHSRYLLTFYSAVKILNPHAGRTVGLWSAHASISRLFFELVCDERICLVEEAISSIGIISRVWK